MPRRALTIAETAKRLGVKPQRVSQLLRDERLRGPDYGTGRAPANVGRVWLSSLRDYERSRRRPLGPTRTEQLEARVTELESVVAEWDGSHPSKAVGARGAEARERAARQAATEMKVAMEVLQGRLEEQLEKNRRVNQRVADLEASLGAATDHGEVLSVVNRALSDSLSDLLVPDDLGTLG